MIEDQPIDWANLDPQDWPHTPPLDVYADLERTKPDILWYMSEGHVHNLFDAAMEERDEARAALARVEALHYPVEVEPSDTICGGCSRRAGRGRFFPTVEWPCPTLCALRGDA